MRKSFSFVRLLAVVMLLLVLAAATYAFAAANTVSPSYAGDGTGTVSGYTISAVSYTLNPAAPTSNVTLVTLTFSAPASITGHTVYIQLLDNASTPLAGAGNIACTVISATQATCNTAAIASVTPLAIYNIRVIAAQ